MGEGELTQLVVYHEPLATLAAQRAHYAAVKRRIAMAAKPQPKPPAPVIFKPVHKPVKKSPWPERDWLVVSSDGAFTPPKLAEILDAVCEVCRVGHSDVQSAYRFVHLAAARHVFMFVARHYTHCSFPRIGYFLGGRDHSTVLHGVRKVQSHPKTFREPVLAVIAALKLPPYILGTWGDER